MDGRLPRPRGLAAEFVEVKPISRAFRRMIRDQEFEIGEIAISNRLLT